MQPPGSHWGTEMKSGLGAVFLLRGGPKPKGAQLLGGTGDWQLLVIHKIQ